MMRSGRRPSPIFRSALALLLVCAQIFAAAHALSHVGELSLLARSEAALSASVSYEGGVPAAERHERCLLCLSAADLTAALPPSLPLRLVGALPPALPGDVSFTLPARRLPRPHSRGPPLSSV